MPKVTVLCITYNHEEFIRKTLEGFVMQKTGFDFEVLVSDDASSDNTQSIISEFAKKYPDIIKPILRKENVGAEENFLAIADSVKSEYVAICEGDDYWTDSLKLQRQVDFLDSHPDYSICFHPVKVVYTDASQSDEIYPFVINDNEIKMFTIEHLLAVNFIQTNSVLYRWRFGKGESIKEVCPKNILPGDYYIHLLHAQKGKIAMISGAMAIYHRHSSGLWCGSLTNPEALHLRHGIKELNFYLNVEKTFSEYHLIKGHQFTAGFARGLFEIYLINQKFLELKQVIEMCPDLFTADLNIAQQALATVK